MHRFAFGEVGKIERRMTSYLEMHLCVLCVLHVPDDMYLVAVQPVSDRKIEVVGIIPVCLGRVGEGEGHTVVGLTDELEIHVPGKAVTIHLEFKAVDAVGVLPESADDGEQDGRVAGPVVRVGLPQVLMTFLVFDALELSSFFCNLNGEKFVFKFFHNENVIVLRL